MPTPTNFLRQLGRLKPEATPQRPPTLIRAYVETGDERCPLAGLWSCRTEAAPAPEEPESCMPAWWSSLCRRAIHPTLMRFA